MNESIKTCFYVVFTNFLFRNDYAIVAAICKIETSSLPSSANIMCTGNGTSSIDFVDPVSASHCFHSSKLV